MQRAMTGRWVMAGVLAAMLAACGGGAANYNGVDVPEQEAEAQAAIERSVAQNGAASTARTGVPIARSTPTAARDRAFPTEFLGYWGVDDDDCELANTAATGRINIDADTIRFYESNARVQGMEHRSAHELAVQLRYSGEGKAWERTETFRLDAGGTALVRGSPPEMQRYRRC
ncbi:hypothetical protein ASE95_13865 [Sphingomonas sp. Leaf231]|nr:hypothetical protein ASE95_13865 [Sphingomonas sp. Leaf231]